MVLEMVPNSEETSDAPVAECEGKSGSSEVLPGTSGVCSVSPSVAPSSVTCVSFMDSAGAGKASGIASSVPVCVCVIGWGSAGRSAP